MPQSRLRLAVFVVACLLASLAWGAPDFPALTGRVVDDADMLSPASEQRLDTMLAGLEKTNGDQLVVVTVPDIGDTTIENYGYQLGRHWGLGQSKRDNGAMLLIAKKQRAIRIEVGYGLEGQLTDARSSLIIRRVIQPAFRSGDFDAGVLQGTAAIVKTLGGNVDADVGDTPRETARSGPSLGHTVMWIVLMIAMVAVFGGGGGGGFGRRRRRRGGLPWFIPMGGGFGGGSGGLGGGGFSGGGGSFGGGGASGGW